MVSENIHTYPKKGLLKIPRGSDFKSQGGGACGGGGDLNLKDLPWGCGYFIEPDNIDIKLIEYLAVIYPEFLGSNHCVHTCSSVDRSRCYFCMANFFFAAAGKK